jgi:hypothetical protein
MSHAILSPSAAYRWTVCTPSARFEEQIPEQDSTYSREGTLAHEVAALILQARTGLYPHSQKRFNTELLAISLKVADFYREQGKPDAYQEMQEYAEDYAEYVRGFIPRVGKHELLIEKKVDLRAYVPLSFGTVDAGLIVPQVLYVTDYKYGAGKRVSAVQNAQMMNYALGLLLVAHTKGYDPDRVVMSIYQPRVSETPSVFEMDTADLLDWAEDVLAPAAALAIAGQGEFIAGSHCDFCKAKTSCRAYYSHFEELKDISDKRQMTAKDLRAVLKYGDNVASWVKKVKEETISKMQNGHRVDGFKLIAGRSVRKFTSENDVVDILFGEGFEFEGMFKAELRGITELEGVLGKRRFEQIFKDIIKKTEGTPAIAEEDDDRPAIDSSAADDYFQQDFTDHEQTGKASKGNTRRRR